MSVTSADQDQDQDKDRHLRHLRPVPVGDDEEGQEEEEGKEELVNPDSHVDNCIDIEGDDDDESDKENAADGEPEPESETHHRPADMTRHEDEADTMVGVSIGHSQNRIKARRTPAEEKNRIMKGNHGMNDDDRVPDGNAAVDANDGGVYLPEVTAEPESIGGEGDEKKEEEGGNSSKRDDQRRDSSRSTSTDTSRRSKDGSVRSSLTKSILKTRRGRDSSPSLSSSLRRFLPGSLSKRSRSHSVRPPKLRHGQEDHGERHSDDRPRPPSWMNTADKRNGSRPTSATRRSDSTPSIPVPGTDLRLKRSSSDHSLYQTPSSTSSSLEELDRYENVHSLVNVRFKAIKDTIHESSKGLLNMHLPDLGHLDYNHNHHHHEQHPDGTDSLHRESTQGGKGAPTRGRPRRNPSDNPYPILSEAMSELTGDIVIMGGYRGSVLRSAKNPSRQLWIPMKAGLNLRKVDLEVGLTHEDEERMEETVIPGEILSHVGPVDVCRRLIKKLQKCENTVNGDLRVHDYGYDWRLSPRLLADRLVKFLQGLPCNAPGVAPEKKGAYVIAHSLGGLIARHAVNQHPELFAGVLYAGVPQHCINILGPLRNGEDVLLNSRVLTAQANFTFRTSFALLPEDGHCFIDKRTKERYPLDFFSAQTWDEYRLSPIIKPALPPMTARHFIGNIPLIGKRFSTIKDGSTEDSTADEVTPTSKRSTTATKATPHEHTKGKIKSLTFTNPAATVPMGPDAHGIIGPSTPAPRIPPTAKAATASTIPRDEAMKYLSRTLSEILQFKKELTFNPAHQSQNRYPPFAVLYSKAIPTVYGAKVWSREHIKHQDAYDDLAFAAGDGVVLASASMLPPKYRIIKDGLVKTERGHVSLLGDLEGVGQCLVALVKGRREGVGLGSFSGDSSTSTSASASPSSIAASGRLPGSDSSNSSNSSPTSPTSAEGMGEDEGSTSK